MKTLLISGAPNPTGQTAFLENLFKQHMSGDVTTLSSFSANLSPCVDCKYCTHTFGCSIIDDMDIVYDAMNTFDNIVISAPIYFAALPGPMLNILSRFQLIFAARNIRRESVSLKPKHGAIILNLGGFDPSKYGPEAALASSKMLLKLNNAELLGTVIAWKTDTLPVYEDEAVRREVIELAAKLSERPAS
ncbi:MAG: flavodoxin family protein [Defluviitaleaceae bacterium]|nr:flavodoxin family protein [Defluviitaleaceae bacterium]